MLSAMPFRKPTRIGRDRKSANPPRQGLIQRRVAAGERCDGSGDQGAGGGIGTDDELA
jgi:hypothetical protein